MEDELEKNEDGERTDHFRLFMFGTNYSSIRKKTEDQEENSHSKTQEKNRPERHRGDAWILGMNSKHAQKEEKKHENNQQQEENQQFDAIANFLEQIDLELLMKSVDSFMTSANEFKPIIKKITPFIKKWID
ncbi:hypothetical protein [Niallia sp. NCCP-28]|uniref:hypothetical protein n=1 Tax=Niallia sp. NCCP-28 TaxID=2934712 RepID=UPI0020854275|nr:hypothetical protein [Niallia sp. NCCP-28]GKU81788.1 hypothetical protein NCCP28_11840 [Niallia sp. NCCP-28]